MMSYELLDIYHNVVLASYQKYLGRTITDEEIAGIRRIKSIMMLESIGMSFGFYSIEKLEQQLAYWKNNISTNNDI